MFALINTFVDNAVISRHRSALAAHHAQQATQRGVREHNGPNAGLPMMIVEYSKRDMSDARRVLIQFDWEGDYEGYETGEAVDI